jgi:hypothetical protein
LAIDYSPARLIEYETKKPGPRYGLVLQVDQLDGKLEARGLHGSGYAWRGLVQTAIRLRAPDIEEFLEFDPEADMFVARGDDPAMLATVAGLIRLVIADPKFFEEVVVAAGPRLR